MREILSYRDLDTWREGMTLAELSYAASAKFPVAERFGLGQQLRRAAVSIPCNVAEGHSRRSRQAYLNHLSIALGSEGEVETCLELARRLGFLTEADLKRLEACAGDVRRLLFALIRALNKANPSQLRSHPRFVVPDPCPLIPIRP